MDHDNSPSRDHPTQPVGTGTGAPKGGRESRIFGEHSARVWAVIAGIAAVIALIPTFAQLIPGDSRARVEIVSFSVQKPSEVNADLVNGADARAPAASGSAEATLIDITLKNTGDAPAVLLAADFKFLFAEQLGSCGGGGGEAAIAAQYAIKVPSYPPARPFVVRRDMRFSIDSGHVERLAFSVGPDIQNVSSTTQLNRSQSVRRRRCPVQVTGCAISRRPAPTRTASVATGA